MYLAQTNFREPGLTVRLPPVRCVLAWIVLAAGIALTLPAQAQPAGGETYGPVRRADTLWELALRFRGEANVSAQQAMIAILRANPEAFREGNINALRTGVILRVPTPADMAAITQNEAVAEFSRHEEAWRNRRRTGSASPGPSPRPVAQPSPPPSEPAAAAGDDELEEELREARATVTELRERLVERDEAIEELLVQLATARRELRRAKSGEPEPSAESAGSVDEEAGSGPASGAGWLPVSPLILGSSLIVLLVLIVVVTLLRQRGGGEEPFPEEPDETDDEEGDPAARGGDGEEFETYDPELDERDPGEAGQEPGPRRAGAGATGVGAAVAYGFASDDDDEPRALDDDEARVLDESDDLPIGIDLEGDEDWGPVPEDDPAGPPETPDPEGRSEFGRHVEVGELDDLELDTNPAHESISEPLEGPAEEGATPGGTPGGSREGPRRPRRRRR